MNETALDVAYAHMDAAPEDTSARLGFYECLAASELFLMLETEPGDTDDTVTPALFDLGEAQYVLVFDREERMAAFTGQSTPYLALSGRAIAGMLADQRIGLGVNLEVAPSSVLLPPEAVAWLQDTLKNTPDTVEARLDAIHPPSGLPETLVSALDARLATAMGLARSAYLVGVTYDSGVRGHLLGFVGAVPAAEPALAQAANDALAFSGVEAATMDIAFFAATDPVTLRLERVGLRFDLPQLQETVTPERPAPGMDPEKPPRLK